MKHIYFLIFITPATILFLFELYFIKPKTFYAVLILTNLLIFFTIKLFKIHLVKMSDSHPLVLKIISPFIEKTNKNWKNFLILPMCFATSIAIYSTLMTNKFFTQFLFLLNFLLIYSYIKNTYYYLIHPKFYKNEKFENIVLYGNFLTFFFTSSIIYGLQSFIHAPIWMLMIIITPIIFLMTYNILWINEINNKENFIFILINYLILAEITWSLSFLPLNYHIRALILSICYYVLVNLLKLYLKNILTYKTIKLYLISGCAGIILILLTAQWL
ncbi:hypothetical protein KJ978_02130 [Patescibacteria group bacterium]|nr:hypothetical protein [Patescibacteria group bacterium]MBU2456937.1 hypothetical protein [Patescibacteria group bacterium]